MGKVSTENLIGWVFGRLTVVDTYPRGKQGHVQWVCACSCGECGPCGSSTTCSFGRMNTARPRMNLKWNDPNFPRPCASEGYDGW